MLEPSLGELIAAWLPLAADTVVFLNSVEVRVNRRCAAWAVLVDTVREPLSDGETTLDARVRAGVVRLLSAASSEAALYRALVNAEPPPHCALAHPEAFARAVGAKYTAARVFVPLPRADLM